MGEGEPAGPGRIESEEEVSLLDQALDDYARLMEGGDSVSERELEDARNKIAALANIPNDDQLLRRIELAAEEGLYEKVKNRDWKEMMKNRRAGTIPTAESATEQAVESMAQYDQLRQQEAAENLATLAGDIERMRSKMVDWAELASPEAKKGFPPKVQDLLDQANDILKKSNDVRDTVQLPPIDMDEENDEHSIDLSSDPLTRASTYWTLQPDQLNRAKIQLEQLHEELKVPYEKLRALGEKRKS